MVRLLVPAIRSPGSSRNSQVVQISDSSRARVESLRLESTQVCVSGISVKFDSST